MRRRFKGQRPLVKIGYGSDKRTKGMLASGFMKFRVYVEYFRVECSVIYLFTDIVPSQPQRCRSRALVDAQPDLRR